MYLQIIRIIKAKNKKEHLLFRNILKIGSIS